MSEGERTVIAAVNAPYQVFLLVAVITIVVLCYVFVVPWVLEWWGKEPPATFSPSPITHDPYPLPPPPALRPLEGAPSSRPARPARMHAGMGFLSLEALVRSPNLLIVGNRGSGKTTLLRAILQRRTESLLVFDPHNAPKKWAQGAQVIGGGSDYQACYGFLQRVLATLTHRSKEMNERGRDTFDRLTVISDEWGSVVSEIDAGNGTDPGKLVIRLLKEGRKFGLFFIASAHGDTVASLGCKGESEMFRNSFDWFVYCGAFVKKHAPPNADVPMGQTKEGMEFPLWVVALSPTTGEKYWVDLTGLDKLPPASACAPMVALSELSAKGATFDTGIIATALLNLENRDESTADRNVMEECRSLGMPVSAERWQEFATVVRTVKRNNG